MAEIVKWHGQNKLLKAPKETNHFDLPVFNNGKVSVSCWQLTGEELAEIVQHGGKIYIAVLSGPSQYPMFVGTEDSVRSVVADTGKVWSKSLDILPAIIDNKCPNCKNELDFTLENLNDKYCNKCDILWKTSK